jgi:hypothetical protein
MGIFTMLELAYEKLFIVCWRVYREARDLNVTARKTRSAVSYKVRSNTAESSKLHLIS